jgi:lauroyl/myristoyl acyltransferase
LHAGGESGHAAHEYLARIGSIPVLTDRFSLSAMRKATARRPHSMMLVAFDHISGKRRRAVPFLGGTLPAPTGLARLAEATGATVITAWWETSPAGPRLHVGSEYRIDESLEPADGRNDLHDRIFRELETRVRIAPRDWTEWQNCGSEF